MPSQGWIAARFQPRTAAVKRAALISAKCPREDGPRPPWWLIGGAQISPPAARPRLLPDCFRPARSDCPERPAGCSPRSPPPEAATTLRAHGVRAFPPLGPRLRYLPESSRV